MEDEKDEVQVPNMYPDSRFECFGGSFGDIVIVPANAVHHAMGKPKTAGTRVVLSDIIQAIHEPEYGDDQQSTLVSEIDYLLDHKEDQNSDWRKIAKHAEEYGWGPAEMEEWGRKLLLLRNKAEKLHKERVKKA